MREIKFRGQNKDSKEWFIGSYQCEPCPNITFINSSNELDASEVDHVTVGQFTGLKDKNGVDIYEGDIIQYHYLKRYIQQSHYDVRPEIDELIIIKAVDVVDFNNGCFALLREFTTDEGYYMITTIGNIGLFSIEDVKEQIFGDLLKDLSEEEQSYDCDGSDINDSIIGIEVIGNIHSNPELINNNQN